MIAVLIAAGLAHGAGPSALGLVAEPPEVLAAYAAAVKEKGRSGPATVLDCRPAFDGLLFCLTLVEQEGWRYATAADLSAWGLSSEAAHSRAAKRLRSLPLKTRLQAQEVQGVPGQYFAARLDDGQDAAPLLQPEALARLVGGPPVVAVPAQGALVTWMPGNPLLDKVVAVGVRRMSDAAQHPISSRIYRWGKEGWTVWGEAKKPEP